MNTNQLLTDSDVANLTIADLEAIQALCQKHIDIKRTGESYVPNDLDPDYLKSQGLRFPLTVKLTAMVARQAGVGRELIIKDDSQLIHGLVKDYLMTKQEYYSRVARKIYKGIPLQTGTRTVTDRFGQVVSVDNWTEGQS